MTKIVSKKEFLENENFYVEEIRKGKILIYPTDTIYGIGCDATNGEAIDKIREIKQRDSKPFSVIVPSKEWIFNNCVVPEKFVGELEKLPGKFTLILKISEKVDLAKEELVGDFDTIGVRIPDNWFAEFLSRNQIVFVTTSVNVSGEKPIQKVSDLAREISEKVDYIIEDGDLPGNASTLVDLSKEEIATVER